MKVFKFGGASVKNPEAIRNVASILKKYENDQLLVVISAFDKTTNALEEVVRAYFMEPSVLVEKVEFVKNFHFSVITELFDEATTEAVSSTIQLWFDELEELLKTSPAKPFDEFYDQVVSLGELLSTTIVAAFLQFSGFPIEWLDIRTVIQTDDTFREGKVEWAVTQRQFIEKVQPTIASKIVVTQGFIGQTPDGRTTTLGREGSDYTAAIAAYCLNAESMTVWKDVSGILTADPRLFKNVTKIDRLSFREAIEMTYYGAKVIHPKTIKPLQNKGIPLYVKSFLQPDESGTVISESVESVYPPVIVVEKNQALIQVSRRDFSFVDEEALGELFALLAKFRIKVNMMQNTAIGFSICVNNVPERITKLLMALEKDYKVYFEEGMEFITVRHYHQQIVDELQEAKLVFLEEYLRSTAKMVIKNVLKMQRIDG